jgi:HTH-type transcriptional regulator/antitoxin HigA
MDIRPIRTEEDHRAALAKIETLWDAPEGSPEGDQLDVLTTLVEAYEEARFPIRAGDSVAVVKVAMEVKGYSQTDLAQVLGSAPRASEILNGRRELSLQHIRALHREWNIPAEAS